MDRSQLKPEFYVPGLHPGLFLAGFFFFLD